MTLVVLPPQTSHLSPDNASQTQALHQTQKLPLPGLNYNYFFIFKNRPKPEIFHQLWKTSKALTPAQEGQIHLPIRTRASTSLCTNTAPGSAACPNEVKMASKSRTADAQLRGWCCSPKEWVPRTERGPALITCSNRPGLYIQDPVRQECSWACRCKWGDKQPWELQRRREKRMKKLWGKWFVFLLLKAWFIKVLKSI